MFLKFDCSRIVDDEGWKSAIYSEPSYAVMVLRAYQDNKKPVIPNLFRMFRIRNYTILTVKKSLIYLRWSKHWDETKYINCFMHQLEYYGLLGEV